MYRDALKNNAKFAAAQAEHQAAGELLPQARSRMLPRVDLNANIANSHVRNSAVVDNTYHFTQAEVGVNLVHPLYKKELDIQYAQAGVRVREADAKLEQARQDLALEVSQAYMDVLLVDDNLALIKEQRSAILAQLDQAKTLLEKGYGTVTDVNEARARLDSVDVQDIEARNAYEISLHAFHEITSVLSTRMAMLGSDRQKLQSDTESLDKWIDTAMQFNPRIQQQLARYEASQREVEKARAGDSPALDLVAGVSHAKDPGYTALNTNNTSAEIGLKFSMPLYQGGLTKSRIAMTKALEERARQELEAMRREVMLDTRQEYLNVVSAVVKINALEQALKSHETALDSMQKGFRAGVRTNVEILNQQQLLFTAKRDLNKARYESLVSRLRLKKAAGQLLEEEIALVNGWLVPADAEGQITLAESINRIKHKTRMVVAETSSEIRPASTTRTADTAKIESISPSVANKTLPAENKPAVQTASLLPPIKMKSTSLERDVAGEMSSLTPLYIQLGAFSQPDRALRLSDQVTHSLGREVAQKVAFIHSAGLTKVQMGPFGNRDEADRVRAILDKQLGLTTRVLPAATQPLTQIGPATRVGAVAVGAQVSAPVLGQPAIEADKRPEPAVNNGVHLQLAVLSNKANANALMAEVANLFTDFPPASLLESGTKFKVRVGPFASASVASRAAGRVESKLGIRPFQVKP
jgi:TolC family type I secretion outer membrane protein